ncbi:MAG: hypothetical protein ACHQIM_08800 [Sphingobacteriales bacterium]
MKYIKKSAIVLAVALGLFFTACNKNSGSLPPKQSPAQTSPAATASGQVALNLYKTISGSYGGANLSSGITAPALASNSPSGVNLNDHNQNQVCGFFIDPAISYSTNIGDSIKSQSFGSFAFYFKCNGPGGSHNGLTVTDSLYTAGTGPGYTFVYDLTQYYDVTGLSPDNKHIHVDGNIKSFVDLIYPNNPSKSSSVHNVFLLNGLVIDLSKNADITDGTATFTTQGNIGATTWYFTGTAQFIGNHKVKITILGTTYTVDLLTGKVTV